MSQASLQAVVDSVLRAAKYRQLAPTLVAHVASTELAKGRSVKEAIKATKNQLHQSAAVYQAGKIDYILWLRRLSAAYNSQRTSLPRETLLYILPAHTSTRERIPLLDEFYAQIFSYLPPIRSIVDIACGLNPLTLPWMPVPPDIVYRAYDVFVDQVDFLNQFFAIAGIDGVASARDVTRDPPTEDADLTLILKTLPCLEQIESGAAGRLIAGLRSPYWVASFPLQTIGGRKRGMASHYSAQFETLLGDAGSVIRRLQFTTELVYIVGPAT